MDGDQKPPTCFGVVVIEADGVVADLLRTALTDEGFEVTVFGGAPIGAIEAASGRSVAVLGPSHVDPQWVATVPRLVAAGTRVLVLSDEDFDDAASMLLFAGASGFLRTVDTDSAALVDAVRTTAEGDSALHPSVAAEILGLWRDRGDRPQPAQADGLNAPPPLTDRERQIIEALGEGLTTRLIARQLGVAEKTVEAHKSRLFAKLGVRNQAQAVQVSRERGLLP